MTRAPTSRFVLALCLASLACAGACGGQAGDREPRSASRPRSARLSVRSDPHTERVVEDELASLLGQRDVRSARVVVLSVDDGSILAATGRDRSGPRAALATDEVRCHGSTTKLFTLAAALDAGVVHDGDTFEGGTLQRGGLTIADHEQHGAMSLGDVMAFSSNVGATRVFDRLGGDALAHALDRFGLGARVPEGFGTRPAEDAQLAYGASLEATSLEVAAGYLVVARGGTWPGGHEVVTPTTAAITLGLLEGAVSRADATGHAAALPGVRVAGKTGTVRLEGDRTFGVFVGILPVEAPTHVILVGVETDGEGYSGGSVAAPSFARIARALASR